MSSHETIITLDSTDSTSDYIKDHPEMWEVDFFAVRAVEQLKGRGRHTRTWHSEPGKDLTFSFVYSPDGPLHDLAPVTLATGLGAYRVLRGYCSGPLSLKWPNDICHGNKKMGGVLCELIPDIKEPVMIIGIGININSSSFPDDIAAGTTSLKIITGRDHSIEKIMTEILAEQKKLLPGLSVPLHRGILEEWVDATDSIGKSVLFYREGKETAGKIAGINSDGSLSIREIDNNAMHRYSGEIVFQEDR